MLLLVVVVIVVVVVVVVAVVMKVPILDSNSVSAFAPCCEQSSHLAFQDCLRHSWALWLI